MPKLQEQSIRNFVNGRITEDVVSDFLLPDGAVRESINFHFDNSGDAKVREGLTLLGSQIDSGDTILGIHQFVDAGTGSDSALVAGVNANWYSFDGSTWTSIRSSLTAGTKVRFVTFLDRIFGANGSNATLTWDGTGGFVTTQAASMPTGGLIESFKNRMFTNVTSNPQRLSYSGIADSSFNISWTSGNGNIDFLSDPGDITALKRSQKQLLIFKPDVIYRLNSVTQTEPDPVLSPGTFSQESVVEGDDGRIYYHGKDGIYAYSGGLPQKISKAVDDFIKAVPTTFYENVGGWADNDHVYHSIGDVTVAGVALTNIVLRYTVSSGVWTVYSYGNELRVGARFDDGTNTTVAVGDTDGNIFQFDSGTTDNNTAIAYSLITKNYDFGLRSNMKTITKIAALHKDGTGAKIEWQADDDKPNAWKPIGTLTKKVVHSFNTHIRGRMIRFRISGSGSLDPFVFGGFEILKGNTMENN